jgi:hypothetical protein
MASSVKLSEEIIADAKIVSKVLNRSVSGQIEYWAKIGKIVEENPDLTYEFIKNVLLAKEEVQQGKTEPYIFD